MLNAAAWQPDTRASLGVAVAALLFLLAGFAALFSATPKLKLSRDHDAAVEQLVLTAPIVPPFPRRLHHRMPAPVTPPPLPQIAVPVLPPLAAPYGFTTEDYLNELNRQSAAALRNKVTAGDLQRNLGKVTENPALPDNQGYRTVDGDKIARSGNRCAQIQTVQGSPSPTNRIAIAEPTACPGGSPDAGQDIGQALDAWASKQHRSPPP